MFCVILLAPKRHVENGHGLKPADVLEAEIALKMFTCAGRGHGYAVGGLVLEREATSGKEGQLYDAGWGVKIDLPVMMTELIAGWRGSSVPSEESHQTLRVQCLSTAAVSSVKRELCLRAYKYLFIKVLFQLNILRPHNPYPGNSNFFLPRLLRWVLS